MVFPAYGAVDLFRVGVANPMGDPIPKAPAFVEYTLNCTADVTVEILPSDIAGVPTGAPAVRTMTLPGQAKGPHTEVWACTDDLGVFVPGPFPRYFVAKVTAQSNQAQWDPITGLFTNEEPTGPEYPARPSLPVTGDSMEGFYGMAVNRNVGSSYYGRMYAPHKSNKTIYMYDVDGTYLGAMNTAGISGGMSWPWTVNICAHDYVFVGDRSNTCCYVFAPDGSAWLSKSTVTTYIRGMFVRTDTATGEDHVYTSGGGAPYGTCENIVQSDHVTWGARQWIYDNGAGNAYGMWVSPDFNTIYATAISGTYHGVTRWLRQPAGTYAHDAGWTCALGAVNCADVEMDPTGTFLWVTVARAYVGPVPGPEVRSIFKIDPATGAILGSYDVISWGFHLSGDAVGNIGVTFNKATLTWGSKLWGLFAEPGLTSVNKLTAVFMVTADPAPVVVPGSESWVYTDPSGTLIPNGTDTATLTFEVIDANGYADIGTIDLNLEQLKLTNDPNKIVAPDTKVPHGTDPLRAVCTKVVTAVNGVLCPDRQIPCTVYDVHHNSPDPLYNNAEFTVLIAGNKLSGTVKHVRHNGLIGEAEIVAVGGVSGVYGYPATYRSAKTNPLTGYGEMTICEGSFNVTVEKSGWKTQSPAVVVVGTVTSPPLAVSAGDVYLGALTIAEIRAFTQFTTDCSVEGVCYAKPEGDPPTADLGLADRLSAVLDTLNVYRHQWYMCDPDQPGDGRLFMLHVTDTELSRTWDDPNAVDFLGRSLYIGQRPQEGDFICVTATLYTVGGYETRIDLDWATLLTKPYIETYLNLGPMAGQPPAPLVLTIPQFADNAVGTPYSSAWGKFAQVENVIPVKWRPDGKYVGSATEGPPDLLKYLIVYDAATMTDFTLITFDNRTSLGILPDDDLVPPADLGDTYTFKGAVSKRGRSGETTMRVRGTGDMIKTYDQADPGANTVANVRGVAAGQPVNVRGIVTLKGADYMYIESTDRSSGIRVSSAPTYVAQGDDVQVVGNVMILDGEKQISPTKPIIVHSSANALPGALGMRTRAVGGAAYGPNDPGVTNGRSALNVGLLVKMQGMVSYRDTSATPTYFYLWDGANSIETPVDDGSGHWGTRILHSGWIGSAVVPWVDWVELTGVVSVNDTAVAGKVIPEVIPNATPAKITVFDAMAFPAGTMIAGYNLIGVAAAPAGIGGGDPWAWPPDMPWEASQIIPPGKTQDEIDYRVMRWESANQSMYVYDALGEPNGPFGGVLLGDGYWVNATGAWNSSFTGQIPTVDQWIDPGQANWVLMAHPQNHDTNWEYGGVQMHDGAQVLGLYQACQYGAGWIWSVGYFWDNTTSSLVDIGVMDDLPTEDTLRVWRGYWFQLAQDKKALIIP